MIIDFLDYVFVSCQFKGILKLTANYMTFIASPLKMLPKFVWQIRC